MHGEEREKWKGDRVRECPTGREGWWVSERRIGEWEGRRETIKPEARTRPLAVVPAQRTAHQGLVAARERVPKPSHAVRSSCPAPQHPTPKHDRKREE
jgi:hypothetical protein